MYKTGIYARLSVNQDKKCDSITNQIDTAKSYIRKMNQQPDCEKMAVIRKYTDSGYSGSNFQRPGFNSMIEDIKRGIIDCVIVKDMSRLGRNYIESYDYVKTVTKEYNCRIISISENLDTGRDNIDNDSMFLGITGIVNELYAKDVAVKVESAKKILREKGVRCDGRTPYGYNDEECRSVVDLIKRMYGEGESFRDIIKMLHSRGIHTPGDYSRYGHVYVKPSEELKYWNSTVIKRIVGGYSGEKRQRSKDINKERSKSSIPIKCGICNRQLHKSCYYKKSRQTFSYSCSNVHEPVHVNRDIIIKAAMSELNNLMDSEIIEEVISYCKEENEKRFYKTIRNKENNLEYLKRMNVENYCKYRRGLIEKEQFEEIRHETDRRCREEEQMIEKIKAYKNKTEESINREKIFFYNLKKSDTDKLFDYEEKILRFLESLIEKVEVNPQGKVNIIYKMSLK